MTGELSQQRFDLAVRGDLVLPTGVLRDGVLGILNGRIAAIVEGDRFPAGSLARRQIDARGCWVLPGGVDVHVHCYSNPAEGILRATRGAAAGGTTTIVEMPYDLPAPCTTRERFEAKIELVQREAVADVALLGTVKKQGGLDEIPRLAEAGACGFKLSLYETDPVRFPRIPDDELYEAFRLIAQTGLRVGVHAENDEIVRAAVERLKAAGRSDGRAHCESHPAVAEAEASLRALELAYWTGAPIHLFHVSVPRCIDLVHRYRAEGVRASAETCPHYLLLAEEEMDRLHAFGKINPPLRPRADADRLWAMLADRIDAVSSDHAPWPRDRKSNPDIFANASGAPGVEGRLALMYSAGVATGRLTIERFAEVMATGPARLFNLYPRKGHLAVGADADLAILDPNARWVFSGAAQQSVATWSPYGGQPMIGRVVQTILRGQTIAEDGTVTVEPGTGELVRPVGIGAAVA